MSINKENEDKKMYAVLPRLKEEYMKKPVPNIRETNMKISPIGSALKKLTLNVWRYSFAACFCGRSSVTSALVQKLIAAIAGPIVMRGMQHSMNKKFQRTNVGRPSVIISPRRVGVFSFV